MNAPDPRALKRPTTELRQAVDSLRPYLVRGGVFGLIAAVMAFVPTWYMLETYDRVVNSRSHMTLAMLTIVVLSAYVVMEVLEWANSELMHRAGLAFDAQMSDRVFLASFEANLKHVPGGTIQPLNDLRTLREFLISPLLKSLMELPAALVFLAILFYLHALLGWAAVVGAGVQALVAWLNERSTQPPLTAANRSAFTAQQYADGSLRNAQVIEAMGMLGDIHKRWITKQREFLGLQAIASDRAGLYTSISKFLQIFMGSFLLGMGAWLVLLARMEGGGGTMIIGAVFGSRAMQPMVQIITQWRAAVGARDAWQRINTMLSALPAKAPSMALPTPHGMLSAENLIASAPGTQAPIIKGINFALNPGEALVVIGPSASGKTTLARVLVGLWPSIGGKARLDGADVHAWDKSELGPHVGYLPQGVELFDGTLAENIARFGTLEKAKVENAARAVGLHDFIMTLPDGYDTEVGPEGARLSGGQRQRVGLARALYGDPVFVVLDEPNSSLDEHGDAALASAIVEYKARGTTFVVITHRTSVLSIADKLLLLRDGSMAAFGPRDEVMAAMQKAAQEAQAAAKARAAQAPRQGGLAVGQPTTKEIA